MFNKVVRHSVYFFPDGDITIEVEDSIFRIHGHFLIRESEHFRSMFVPTIPCRDPPGSSETNPVVLENATSEGFADLLWVFYNPKRTTYSATLDKWKRILTLAQQWGFEQVEKLCIKELENLTIPPVEKIRIYQDFNLNPDLLRGSYVALTIQAEPLDVEEGKKLGLSTSLKIVQARELARIPHGATSCLGPETARLRESEVQSVIKDVFGLRGSAYAPTTPPPSPPPQPTPASRPTSDERVVKAAPKTRKSASQTRSRTVSVTTEDCQTRSHSFVALGAISPMLFLIVYLLSLAIST